MLVSILTGVYFDGADVRDREKNLVPGSIGGTLIAATGLTVFLS